MWGAILTGVFCSSSVNPAAPDGLIYGNASQLLPQIEGVIVTIIVAVVFTTLILKVTSLFLPLRVDEDAEKSGLDHSEHGESAYSTF